MERQRPPGRRSSETDGPSGTPLRLIDSREAWIFTATVAVLLVAIGWATFGKLTTTKVGAGTLMSRAGTGRVVSADTAVLAGFTVERGDEIRVNEVVALLKLPAIEHQIDRAARTLESLEAEMSSALEEAPRFTQGREIGDSISIQHEKNLEELRDRLGAVSNELDMLEIEKERRSKLRSPFAGHIFEINLPTGAGVEPGDAVVTVAPIEEELSVIAFVAQSGGRPAEGSAARVLPVSLESTEFGYIKARVTRVSITPQSRAQILRYLRSEDLTDSLVRQGEPYRVELELLQNPDNPSGLEWTLGAGPPSELPYGTLCDVEIISRELSPLQLAFPALRD